MKRFASFVFFIYMISAMWHVAMGEDFLPSLDKAFGISIPSIQKTIDCPPAQKQKLDDGRYFERYENISYKNYEYLGKCFAKSGFSETSKTYINHVIYIVLEKETKIVKLNYDINQYELVITYPEYFTNDDECYVVSENDPSVFPGIEELAGPILPRLSAILNCEPDDTTYGAGKYVEEYTNFNEENYKQTSEYLLKQACNVKDYYKDGNVLFINLVKDETEFTFSFDPDKHKATIEYNDQSIIEPMVTNTPAPTTPPKLSAYILDNQYVKKLISSCPAIAKNTKDTKEYFSDSSTYNNYFINGRSAPVWRISIQSGITYFADESKMYLLMMIPKGKASELIPILKWEISLLEALPSIIRDAEQSGITVYAEKRVDGGDFAEFADSNGVIDLLIQSKYEGVLKQDRSNLGMLELIEAFGSLGN